MTFGLGDLIHIKGLEQYLTCKNLTMFTMLVNILVFTVGLIVTLLHSDCCYSKMRKLRFSKVKEHAQVMQVSGRARVASQVWNLRLLAAQLSCLAGSGLGAGHSDASTNKTRCCLKELTAQHGGQHAHGHQ